LDCQRFEIKTNSSFQIFFHFSKMTLPKFILQLVHIFAEIGIEKGLPESLPAIYFKKEEPKNYEYKYLFCQLF